MSAIRRKVVICRDASASRWLRSGRPLLAALAGLFVGIAAPAQTTLYWDTNGSTSGAGSTPTGTWSGGASNWTTSFWGNSATTNWTGGANALFSAGFDATNAYTVTVAGTQNLSSLTVSMGSPTFTGGTLNFNDTTPDLWTISGSTATIRSVIAGSSGLTKTGGGTAILDGSAKTYTGATTVNGGTLQLNASNILNNSSALAVGTNGTFALNSGISETLGALSGDGVVDLRTGALIVGADSSSSSFGGSLLGTGSFTKAGTGILTLASDLSFSGTFNLAGGTLRLSDIVLNLATLNITGNSTIDFAGVDASLFVTNLNISAGVTVNVTNWTNAVDYFYAQNWSGAVTNTRNAPPMNQVIFNGFTANSTQWQGYDRQVTPVPEPAAGGALLLGLVSALVAWRRRCVIA